MKYVPKYRFIFSRIQKQWWRTCKQKSPCYRNAGFCVPPFRNCQLPADREDEGCSASSTSILAFLSVLTGSHGFPGPTSTHPVTSPRAFGLGICLPTSSEVHSEKGRWSEAVCQASSTLTVSLSKVTRTGQESSGEEQTQTGQVICAHTQLWAAGLTARTL